MAETEKKLLDGAGLAKLIELIKHNSGGGSSLPDYPTTAGNYQLLLAIDNSGESELGWITLSGVWQYPLQIDNNLALYQGAVINQYNNNLEVV